MHEIAEVVDDAFEEDTDFNLCPRCWISLLIKIVTKPLSWESAICKMTKMTETCISPFLSKCKKCLLLWIHLFSTLLWESKRGPPNNLFRITKVLTSTPKFGEKWIQPSPDKKMIKGNFLQQLFLSQVQQGLLHLSFTCDF